MANVVYDMFVTEVSLIPTTAQNRFAEIDAALIRNRDAINVQNVSVLGIVLSVVDLPEPMDQADYSSDSSQDPGSDSDDEIQNLVEYLLSSEDESESSGYSSD